MRVVLAVAVLAGMIATSADAGPCSPAKSRACTKSSATVDFNFVPDPSQQIVTDKPPAQAAKKPSFDSPDTTPYTGPTVGVAPLPRAPTVGYHWSLQ